RRSCPDCGARRGPPARLRDMDTATGPLAGIRVLQIGGFTAGPFAGPVLGALVCAPSPRQPLGHCGPPAIRVRPPDGGDPMRRWGQTLDGEGIWWPAIGRNKRSVVADLRTEEGRALVQAIARTADVVLENFRPGRLAEYGLDHPTLSA